VLFHKRDRTRHFTTYGFGTGLVSDWLRSRGCDALSTTFGSGRPAEPAALPVQARCTFEAGNRVELVSGRHISHTGIVTSRELFEDDGYGTDVERVLVELDCCKGGTRAFTREISSRGGVRPWRARAAALRKAGTTLRAVRVDQGGQDGPGEARKLPAHPGVRESRHRGPAGRSWASGPASPGPRSATMGFSSAAASGSSAATGFG